jgi:hypothetical protein
MRFNAKLDENIHKSSWNRLENVIILIEYILLMCVKMF